MGVAAYPSKLRARRRRERILRVSLLALGLAVVLGSLVALAYLPRVTITTIDLEGLSTIPQEEVRAAVERELSQRYFFLLPKRNIFLYPRAGIERALLGGGLLLAGERFVSPPRTWRRCGHRFPSDSSG